MTIQQNLLQRIPPRPYIGWDRPNGWFGFVPRPHGLANELLRGLDVIARQDEIYSSGHKVDNWEELRGSRMISLVPGDYTRLGPLKIDWGTPEKPVFLTCEESYVHPCNTAYRAILESFDFQNSSNVILHGLTFRGNSVEKTDRNGVTVRGGAVSRIANCDNIVIDSCLLEQWCGIGALRVIDSTNVSFQRNVVRKRLHFAGDSSGVGFYASTGFSASGNQCILNEFADVTAGVAVPAENGLGTHPGLLIGWNTVHFTDYSYSNAKPGFGCMERGYDLKAGGTEENPLLLINNFVAGVRPTDQNCGGTGSAGTGITLHRNAQNVVVDGNVVVDCPTGIEIHDARRDKPDEHVGNIVIENNLIAYPHDIGGAYPDSERQVGIFSAIKDYKVQNNTILGCKNDIQRKGNGGTINANYIKGENSKTPPFFQRKLIDLHLKPYIWTDPERVYAVKECAYSTASFEPKIPGQHAPGSDVASTKK